MTSVMVVAGGAKFVRDDGGRAAAGYSGTAGDCVVRAIAIATGISRCRGGRPYNAISLQVHYACACGFDKPETT